MSFAEEAHMRLWLLWWDVLRRLRPAFGRTRTFLWFTLCVAGLTLRPDLRGVTSVVRALGLSEEYYDRLLDFFHSKAVNIDTLARCWARLLLTCCDSFLLRHNGRLIILGDGIKAPKCGRKMPAVKKLHQESESNTKPAFIFGHSCQAIALVAGFMETFFAIPLACRIHEGVVFSNRDTRTLLDKMMTLLKSVAVDLPYYFVADAYYACRATIKELLARGNHLISRVRSNAVAYTPATHRKKRRGRRRIYGEKVRVRSLLDDMQSMRQALSPVYGERSVLIRYRCIDLLWRPAGVLVRFVAVVHPHRGAMVLMSTDTALAPLDIIRLYGIRFKIEVSFKQAVHTVGAYAYHFWMADMTPRTRRSGNQYLHMKTDDYRQKVRRKIRAYHCHLQTGLIAQGLLQYLSLSNSQQVWNAFGSWIRTIRPGVLPSESVVATAMRHVLPSFLADSPDDQTFAKFLRPMIDVDRAEGLVLAA